MRKTQTQKKKLHLKNNIEKICNNINQCKRPTQKVKLLAVTKNHPIETIVQAQRLGLQCFGENKVQEAEKKINAFQATSELHMIGHLQSNKTKKAITLFDVIQTVDTLKLAKKINEQAKEINKKQRIYCQINIGRDINKKGFTRENLYKNIVNINQMPNLLLEGIMTILPANLNNKQIEDYYHKTYFFKEKVAKKTKQTLELSMGMSHDYKIAIKCGASIIRVGTKLFGARK